MQVQSHGILQSRKEEITIIPTLSVSPINVMFDLRGRVMPGLASNQTITVTAGAGNEWTAYVETGGSYVRINGTLDGTATGTGNGSFTVDMNLASEYRMGTVVVTSSAPTAFIDLEQDDFIF